VFLNPPARFFAAWTPPVPDRRPTLLVLGLVAVFAAVLVIQALSDYFGLSGAAPAVSQTVLPALVLWFLKLTAAFRIPVLDRVLGLDNRPRAAAPTRPRAER
jgi:cation-transporting ATPase E